MKRTISHTVSQARLGLLLAIGGLLAVATWSSRPALAGTTTRVSVASDGTQGNSSSSHPAISADGRYVAFESGASNLVAGDTKGFTDVFTYDRQTGETSRVSVASDGTQANHWSLRPVISADGRYIAFCSWADNLVPDDTNGYGDVFRHDRQTGVTELVSVASDGTQGDESSGGWSCAISADGRYVAFDSDSTNLVENDTNGADDVFVRDLQEGITERVSVSSDGTQGDDSSGLLGVALSADGRYVAFDSWADNLVAGYTGGLFRHDRQTGETDYIAPGATPSLSADGRYVAFESGESDLVPDDTNGYQDVFVYDFATGEIERVSVASDGTQGNFYSGFYGVAMSADGRYVAFDSDASNLVANDTNGLGDIFMHDRQTGTTERANVANDGTQANGESQDSPAVSIGGEGPCVAFNSGASNLVADDTNEAWDIFVRDLGAFQPDAMLRNDGNLDYVGDNVYNVTGNNQMTFQGVAPGGAAVYQVKVQNDGEGSDRFTVTGTASGEGWKVKYYSALSGGQNITDQVTGSGWTTALLAPGASRKIRVEVGRDPGAASPRKDVLVTVASTGDPSRQDAVRASTLVSPPLIKFTYVPDYGSFDWLDGKVEEVDPAEYMVAVYIYVNGWWTKPYWAWPLTTIQSDRTWTCDITTGGVDETATRIAAFLVPVGYDPPLGKGDARLAGDLYEHAVSWCMVDRPHPNAREIFFSGYWWKVKDGRWGPGPNYFSNSTDNVWLDEQGRLHLRITNRDDKWYCAEVISKRTFGYGTYRFYLDSRVDNLDPEVVLGLFTWSDDAAYYHREIDIEFSWWENLDPDEDDPNAQYVVQPYWRSGHRWRWRMPGMDQSTHLFDWNRERVFFQSLKGHRATPSDPSDVIQEWTCSDAIPPTGDENARMNLWLYNGQAPTDNQEWEVIISRFEFVPSSAVPDLMIRNAGETTYRGNNVYNHDGTDQTKIQRVEPGATATYELKVQNEGTVTDRFKIMGAAGGSTWKVKYYDAPSGGNDITAQVIDAGWTTPSLGPWASQELRVEVTPGVSVPGNVTKEVLVTAIPTGDSTRKDTVKASTTVTKRQPDLLIRNPLPDTYIGDNVYNANGANQTKEQTVASGKTAKYYLKLQNDGNVTDNFTLTGTPGSPAWTVAYYDSSGNLIADEDPTDPDVDWSVDNLAARGSRGFRVEVTPGSTATGGTVKPVLVTATSVGDPTKKDAVKASTTVAIRYRPDLLIRNPGETTYAGDNVYNTNGANQTREQTVASGKTAKYYLKLQNDGNVTDSFTLTGTPGSSAWTVAYYDSSGNPIVDEDPTDPDVDWSVDNLAARGSRGFWVEVTPGSGVASGTVKHVLVKATSTGDSTRQDVVKASTTVR